VDAFDDDFFPDQIVVYPRSYVPDATGYPLGFDGAGATLSGSVQPATTSEQLTRREDAEGQPIGRAKYNVLFTADPSVSASDQRLVWITHAGVALTHAVTLTSEGASEQPGGSCARWTVSASRLT
jgi:hypothetical protein